MISNLSLLIFCNILFNCNQSIHQFFFIKQDDEKICDFVYQIEQDKLFGLYVNQREEFLKDWDAEEYDPAGA